MQQQARTYPGTGGVVGHFAPKPKKPQAPIHPGSTPEDDGEGNEAAARFLAYNSLGECSMVMLWLPCCMSMSAARDGKAACVLLR